MNAQSTDGLTVGGAAEYLQRIWNIHREVASLIAYRYRRTGPVYFKIGRSPRYLPKDLDKYAQSLIGPRQESTTKLVGAPKGRKLKTGRPRGNRDDPGRAAA